MTMSTTYNDSPCGHYSDSEESFEYPPLSRPSCQQSGCFKCSSNATQAESRFHGGLRSTRHRKSVSFDSIRILEFPPALGDNPSVRDGPPLTLSWRPQRIKEQRLDVYEIFRDRRRERPDLFLPTSLRIKTLLLEGYTEEELMDASAECVKVKRERFVSATNEL
ncbi:hypothetical protein IV203_024312 [Nitzschia inconspicua]|uniref:Uncharacterized protein n=1 Tax=Nitzschia inconspicua TaxID=303405 RepID=A0A9K3PD65_9STRA|nr:hypothetical protein IV203_024312 [Nitzschia inconspicua]